MLHPKYVSTEHTLIFGRKLQPLLECKEEEKGKDYGCFQKVSFWKQYEKNTRML